MKKKEGRLMKELAGTFKEDITMPEAEAIRFDIVSNYLNMLMMFGLVFGIFGAAFLIGLSYLFDIFLLIIGVILILFAFLMQRKVNRVMKERYGPVGARYGSGNR